MLCSEWSLVNHQPTEITVVPLRCHCWHCDECRPIRTARLVEEAKAGLPNLFVTLTIKNPGHGSPDEAAVRLAHAWREVRRLYVKEHGKGSIPFLAVFERTKKGWPHIHIVARCRWLDQEWLAEVLDDLIDSPVCWVERIHGKSKIASYITKYISKNPERFTGVKRYWRSLDYLFPPDPEDEPARARGAAWEIERIEWRFLARCIALGDLWIRWDDKKATVLPWRPP